MNTPYLSAVIRQVTQLNSMKYSPSMLKNLLATCAYTYVCSSVTAGVTLLWDSVRTPSQGSRDSGMVCGYRGNVSPPSGVECYPCGMDSHTFRTLAKGVN